jgi:curved DNA-binding protein CbpA
MTFDPYEALGVDRNANPEQIKAAHRKAVKKHHPDTGGEREEFEKATRAMVILSDPDKRAKYDNTGSTDDKPDNSDMMAVSMIVSFVERAIEEAEAKQVDPSRIPMVKAAVDFFTKEIAAQEQSKNPPRAAAQRLERVARRFKSKGKNNILISALLNQVKNYEARIADADVQIAQLRKVLALLDEYSFDQMPMDAGGMYARPIHTGSIPGFFTNSTT